MIEEVVRVPCGCAGISTSACQRMGGYQPSAGQGWVRTDRNKTDDKLKYTYNIRRSIEVVWKVAWNPGKFGNASRRKIDSELYLKKLMASH